MVIDATVSVVALLSGLIGALASAYLGYVVRIKVKERGDQEHRKAVAHVNFLQLTDFVASDFYLKVQKDVRSSFENSSLYSTLSCVVMLPAVSLLK